MDHIHSKPLLHMFRNLASSIGYVTCDRPGTGIIRLFIPSLDSLRRAPRAVIWFAACICFFLHSAACTDIGGMSFESESPCPSHGPSWQTVEVPRSHGRSRSRSEEAERSDQEHPEKGRLRPSRDDLPFGSEKSRLTTSGLGVCAIN